MPNNFLFILEGREQHYSSIMALHVLLLTTEASKESKKGPKSIAQIGNSKTNYQHPPKLLCTRCAIEDQNTTKNATKCDPKC